MKTQKRKKLCLSCNGSVGIEVIVCPFCGRDLLTEEKEELENSLYQPPSKTLTPNQTIASLYPPAYSPEQGNEASQNQGSPKQHLRDPSSVQDPFQETLNEMPVEKTPGAFLPIFIFSLGAFLFSLGLFIFFFSTNGYAILKWNAKYWFMYFLMALPLLVWGYRLLSRLDQPRLEEEEEFEDDEFEDQDDFS